MTITLELPPELEARVVAEAKAKGVSVAEIVKSYLVRQRAWLPEAAKLSPDDWDQAWDELLDSLPEIPTLSDEAISRESIYNREDDL